MFCFYCFFLLLCRGPLLRIKTSLIVLLFTSLSTAFQLMFCSNLFMSTMYTRCAFAMLEAAKVNDNKLRPPRYASAPCKFTISSYLFARWHLFRHVGYLRHQQQVDLWPIDLETGVRVTCYVTCATSVQILVFLGLSVLELGPMYATDRRQTEASLNASAIWRRRHIIYLSTISVQWHFALASRLHINVWCRRNTSGHSLSLSLSLSLFLLWRFHAFIISLIMWFVWILYSLQYRVMH